MDTVGKEFYENTIDNKFTVIGTPPPEKPLIFEFIMPLVTVGIFILLGIFHMDATQGGGKAMTFGKSRAKLQKEDDTKITFEDVVALKEEKEELKEVVDFLKKSQKISENGCSHTQRCADGRPSGYGKTYLSKAVAGEAKVPFFSISGSDFVEMFVGVGASRVRDMFAEAKKHSPSIVFIDEIDALLAEHVEQGLAVVMTRESRP